MTDAHAEEMMKLLSEISTDLKDLYDLLLEHGKDLSKIEQNLTYICSNIVGSIGDPSH